MEGDGPRSARVALQDMQTSTADNIRHSHCVVAMGRSNQLAAIQQGIQCCINFTQFSLPGNDVTLIPEWF